MYYTDKIINIPSEVIVNQTRKYLVQQLIFYGDEFMNNIKVNNILVYAIQDYGIHKTDGSRKIEPSVYMLFDVNGHKKFGNYLNIHTGRFNFARSLQYFQNHISYQTDYCYDSNKNGHLHVVVLKLPFPDKFDYWFRGEYSKMYSEKELDQWIVKTIKRKEGKETKIFKTDQYCVLSHDEDYFPLFQDQVYNEFGTRLTEDSIKAEFDFPPKLSNEILRYDI